MTGSWSNGVETTAEEIGTDRAKRIFYLAILHYLQNISDAKGVRK